MIWDNWGLPIEDNGDSSNTPNLLGNYFIALFLFKKQFDIEFKTKYPQRARQDGETVEDYDNYLTQHLNAYRSMLDEQDMAFFMDSDVYFNDKLQNLIYGDNELQIHPRDHNRQPLNEYNKASLYTCLLIYGFTEVLKKQKEYIPTLINLQNGRASALIRYLGDLILLISILLIKSPESQVPQLVAAKHNPTFLSKLANKIFIKKDFWGNIVRPDIFKKELTIGKI